VAGQAATKIITSVNGYNFAPNVIVQFAVGDLDITEGNYQLVVEGTISGRTRKAVWPLIIEPVVN
jgi:hypothetical protein